MRLRRSGSVAIEVAMWLPVLLLLITGVFQFGKITYTYYSLKKAVDTVAAYLATQNGVNYCNGASDPIITNAINFAISGSTDGAGTPAITNLTPDMITVTTQCVDPVTGAPGDCDTSGCGNPAGGQRPDLIIVSIPNGYIVQPRIAYILLDPIPLRPQAVMPNGGGS
jgi:Flp pilus assembly protein TadG